MHPILFRLPVLDLPVYGFGMMVMLAMAAAFWVAHVRAKSQGLDPSKTLDLCLYAVVFGLVGARLTFLLLEHVPDPSKNSILSLFAIWEGGLTFQGGLALGVAAVAWFMHVRFWPTGRYLDVLAPAILVGAGIGRIGCFLRGCCWGRVAHADASLSAVFPIDSPVAESHAYLAANHPVAWSANAAALGYPPETALPLPVLPTQWFEAAAYVLLAMAIMLLERTWRKRFPGAIFLLSLGVYSLFRFSVEFYRDDTPPVAVFAVGPAWRQGQWFSLLTLVIVAVAWLVLQWRAASMRPGDSDLSGRSGPSSQSGRPGGSGPPDPHGGGL